MSLSRRAAFPAAACRVAPKLRAIIVGTRCCGRRLATAAQKEVSMVAFEPDRGDTCAMKAKAAHRSFVTRSIRAARLKDSVLAPVDPLSRPQPFLVQALRLRSRKSPRG